MNILIPMSGRGNRFIQAGYKLPKPLIDVNGRPMIQRVVENLSLPEKYIFLVLKEHFENFDLKNLFSQFCNNQYEIITVNKITEGAACTCLLAENLINSDEELIIANSDQLIDWDSEKCLNTFREKKADGGILTFPAQEEKWSYAKSNDDGWISEVAEKRVISQHATVGVYWFKHGRDFVMGAKSMISKNIRTNNEFYVCPVFNELIASGKKIYNYPINKMYGLGTPTDLECFLNK